MKSLKRLLIISTVAISFIGVNESPASARNNKCVKVGTFKTAAKVKYECKRLTTGLRWVKVQTKVIPTTPAEVIISIPTDWSNIEKYAQNIPYAAWKASVGAMTTGMPQMPTVNIINGPNALIAYSTPEVKINLTSRLFSSAKQLSQVNIMRFGYDDIGWANSKWLEQFNGQDNSVPREIFDTCKTTTTCWGGISRNTKNGIAWFALATMKDNLSEPKLVNGTNYAHSYAHAIQYAALSEIPAQRLPRWLLEGVATYSQAAVEGMVSFDLYKSERTRETGGLNNSLEWLESFLAPTGNDWSHWNKYTGNDSWRVYDVGFMATEALVALRGPNTVMSLYTKVGNGQTFDQAFNELYGISWAEAHKIIARVIFLQINK